MKYVMSDFYGVKGEPVVLQNSMTVRIFMITLIGLCQTNDRRELIVGERQCGVAEV